jgi:hypothetical protein
MFDSWSRLRWLHELGNDRLLSGKHTEAGWTLWERHSHNERERSARGLRAPASH